MTSYLLKTGHRASFLLEFVEKHVAAGPSRFFLFWLFLCLLYNQELFFSRPSKVEVVVKNELYHVKKNPFNKINVSKIIIFAESSLDSL